jgi:hypothetical protein
MLIKYLDKNQTDVKHLSDCRASLQQVHYFKTKPLKLQNTTRKSHELSDAMSHE